MGVPIISVVIPTYNVGPYIDQCIQSVLHQSVRDLEIIVVDDASSDNTLSKLKMIEEPRLRIIECTINLGPSIARNRGLAVSRGDWIAVLDGDDWVDSDYLERLLHFAVQEKADIVFSDIMMFSEDDVIRMSWTERHPRLQTLGARGVTVDDVIEMEVGLLQPFISRSFIKQHSISYEQGLRIAEDWAFLLDCALAGANIRLYPNVLYHYRVNQKTSLASNGLAVYKGQASAVTVYLQNPNRLRGVSKDVMWKLRKRQGQRWALYCLRLLVSLLNCFPVFQRELLGLYHNAVRRAEQWGAARAARRK